MRANLTEIAGDLSGEINIADPQRASAIAVEASALVTYIDDYRQAQ